jgi:hypothetical protein
MMKLNCVWCDRPFEAKRSSAKYCSDACKTAQHRYNPKAQIEYHLAAALSHITQIERITEKDKDVHMPGYEAISTIMSVANYHLPSRKSWWWDRSNGNKVQGRLPGDDHRHELELWQLLDTRSG